MAISFACACGKRFRAGLGAAGKRIRCPACAAIVTVPKPDEAPAATKEEQEPESSAAENAPPAAMPAPAAAPPSPVDQAAARAAALKRYKSLLQEKPETSLKEHAYWLLLLAFLPLTISLLQGPEQSTEERLLRSLQKASPATQEKIAKAMFDAGKD